MMVSKMYHNLKKKCGHSTEVSHTLAKVQCAERCLESSSCLAVSFEEGNCSLFSDFSQNSEKGNCFAQYGLSYYGKISSTLANTALPVTSTAEITSESFTSTKAVATTENVQTTKLAPPACHYISLSGDSLECEEQHALVGLGYCSNSDILCIGICCKAKFQTTIKPLQCDDLMAAVKLTHITEEKKGVRLKCFLKKVMASSKKVAYPSKTQGNENVSGTYSENPDEWIVCPEYFAIFSVVLKNNSSVAPEFIQCVLYEE